MRSCDEFVKYFIENNMTINLNAVGALKKVCSLVIKIYGQDNLY